MDLKEIGINTRNWDNLAQKKDYWRALINAEFELPGSIIYGVN